MDIGTGRGRATVVCLLLVLATAVTACSSASPQQAVRAPVGSADFSLNETQDPRYVTYLRDLDRMRGSLLFDPFRSFRNPDRLDGRFINVRDEERVSFQQPSGSSDSLDVWFFGGSPMFGDGLRDRYTIPSEVARLAEADGLSLRVHNFGVSGYTNWQAALLLGELLTSRESPDMVVTYGGANEVSLYDGPGSPTRQSHWFAEQAHEIITQSDRANFDTSVDYTARLTNASPDNAARLFRQALDLFKRLARGSDVPIAQFVQPVLWTTDNRQAQDAVMEKLHLDASTRDTRTEEWRQFRAQLPESDAVDLGDVLDTAPGEIFTDELHIDEAGAAIVADAIYQHLKPLLADLS